MRVFAAHLATETNTFAPVPTDLAAFEEVGLYDGDGTARDPRGFQAYVLSRWKETAMQAGDAFHEGLAAFAQPGGRVPDAAFGHLLGKIEDGLARAMPVDAVLLSLHGAMAADGEDDCEGAVLRAVRERVGRHVFVGAVLDPHCHLTRTMVETADVLVCYKEYPHTDVLDRADELYALARRAVAGEVRPVAGVAELRMVAMFPTRAEPAAGFVRRLKAAEAAPGILSASLVHGFPWADVAEAGAKALVYADGDAALARGTAAGIARAVWDARDALAPDFLTVGDAVARLRTTEGAPVVIADVADNAGGGAPSDSTFLLQALLDAGVEGVVAGAYFDPGAVGACICAGEGTTVDLNLGGKYGAVSGRLLALRAEIVRIAGDHAQTGLGGSRVPLGNSAWVRARGAEILVSSVRSQVFCPDAFTGIGMDLGAARAVVLKSTLHFEAGFAPIAAEVWRVTSPGVLDMDFANLPYAVRDTNYWPRVADPWGKAGPS